MIKYHFDDEEKIKEMLTMITKGILEEELEKLPYYEKMKISLAESEEKFEQSERQRLEMVDKLSQKDTEIAEKDTEIAEKEERIEKLEKLLLNNNIVF